MIFGDPYLSVPFVECAATGTVPARASSESACWSTRYRCRNYLIDLAFPAERVAVEVDGWAWHVDAERFLSDRRRQNALVNAGWTVLRFTWHDLEGNPTRVVAEIRTALARSQP